MRTVILQHGDRFVINKLLTRPTVHVWQVLGLYVVSVELSLV